VVPSPYPADPSPSSCPTGALTSFCDGAGTGGATGSGGSGVGTGGAGMGKGGTGIGGGGGSGGAANTPALSLPDCVTNLMAACPPAGACTGQAPGIICFASGVRATHTMVARSTACGGGMSDLMTVTKADGGACYSIERYVDNAMLCEGTRYLWRDAAGVLVATGVDNPYNNPTTTVTCTTGGASGSCHAPINSGIPCCGITQLGTSVCSDSSVCVMGNCP
jgi:hypothetical protein